MQWNFNKALRRVKRVGEWKEVEKLVMRKIKGVEIPLTGKLITMLFVKAGSVGNRTLGAIDYLRKVHGHPIFIVSNFKGL